MNARIPRILLIAGLGGMVLGAVDPLEGGFLIAPAAALMAAGAYLGRSPRRNWFYVAAALVAVGVGAMMWLSALGGVGGPNSGNPWWWGLSIVPYPAGWLLGLVLGIRELRAGSRHTASPVAAS